MLVNKVVCNSSVLIDLTSDTIKEDQMCKGYTAHDKSGAIITGTAECFPLVPIYYDYNIGYIASGVWNYENPTNTFTDIYEAEANTRYLISLGSTVGTRFRSMFTTEDVTLKTSGTVSGVNIINKNNPAVREYVIYNSTANGYILVAKDNIGKSGLKSYVINLTKTCA